MKDKLAKIRDIMKVAAKHKYGDGDYTAFFDNGLTLIDELTESLDSEELVEEVVHKICPYVKVWMDTGREIGSGYPECHKCPASEETNYGKATSLCRGVNEDIAQAAIDTIKGN